MIMLMMMMMMRTTKDALEYSSPSLFSHSLTSFNSFLLLSFLLGLWNKVDKREDKRRMKKKEIDFLSSCPKFVVLSKQS